VPVSKSIPSTDIQTAIERLVTGIAEQHPGSPPLLLLGIANGGILLAKRLAAKLKNSRVGTLDISFHRDDIGRNPIPKEFAATQIPIDVNGATVILVDDVLFSGRTVKAALNELFDHGRPAKVELAILVDRGGRRLPFAPDYTGLVVPTTERQKVVVSLVPDAPARDSISILPAS
jgi:pyrimidine operon attenuation protein/uracil phosphoribosyltransferase